MLLSSDRMKIATYNVNGVNGRLPRLLEWLNETQPDIVCLQELKTDDTKFPIKALVAAGYGAVWHGQRAHHGVAILAKGEVPREIRRGLGGDATDILTRYLEAEVKGIVVASVYLPNGNPVPSPRTDAVMQPETRAAYQRLMAPGSVRWTSLQRNSTLHQRIRIAGSSRANIRVTFFEDRRDD